MVADPLLLPFSGCIGNLVLQKLFVLGPHLLGEIARVLSAQVGLLGQQRSRVALTLPGFLLPARSLLSR